MFHEESQKQIKCVPKESRQAVTIKISYWNKTQNIFQIEVLNLKSWLSIPFKLHTDYIESTPGSIFKLGNHRRTDQFAKETNIPWF
jgi:hypothetical protein